MDKPPPLDTEAETPVLTANGTSIPFLPGGQQIAGLPPQIIAPVGDLLSGDRPESIDFEVTLTIKGSETLQFLPLGDTTEVIMRSAWPSPSFNGNYLPDSREITDDGFTANWKMRSPASRENRMITCR